MNGNVLHNINRVSLYLCRKHYFQYSLTRSTINYQYTSYTFTYTYIVDLLTRIIHFSFYTIMLCQILQTYILHRIQSTDWF